MIELEERHKNFLARLQSFRSLPIEEVDFFWNQFQRISIRKKRPFMVPGEDASRLALLTSGLLKVEVVDDKTQNRFIRYFIKPGEPAIDFVGYVESAPSTVMISAVEPAEILVSPANFSQILYSRHPLWVKVGLELTQKTLLGMEKLHRQLVTMTAEQRYRMICEEDPELSHRVPNKDFASYLGITASSFSRMIKNHSLAEVASGH